MKVTTEQNTTECSATVTVEVDEEQTQRALQAAARTISRVRPMRGYRPGKAPYATVERAFGKETLLEQAIDEMAQEIYRQVIKDEKIDVYDMGKMDVVQKDPPILKYTIPTRPVVTLGDYKSLQLQPHEIKVEDEEVDKVIEDLRKEQAEMIPVTRPVQMGDLVTVNLKGGIEGRDQTDREGVQITVTNERPIFPWLEQLVGMNASETRDIEYVYGDDAPEEIKGKKATYTVTVTDVKEPKLPELNDEFAKSISVLETMEQLRARIRTNQHQQKEVEEENRFADEVLDAIIEQSQIHFPASMLDDEVESEINRAKDLAARLGFTWDKYLELGGRDEATYRDDTKPAAEKRLKRLLTMMQLAEAENIDVSRKEIDVEIDMRAQAAEYQGGNAAQTRRALANKESRQNIEFTLRLRKAMDRVVAMVKGEPTGGKIITPEMLREEMRQIEAAQAHQTQLDSQAGVSPSGIITDPSQVRDTPAQLGKIIIPGQE